ncbi:RTC4 domain-containing protein [Mycena chlorophos]|uniref:RTC4 domain-containing protein n=1 Tax=Mycena chlorophos TaxID=658473 RepID=A0A8H6SZG1_MYCCL|nr:RTC4 domain-containing protein [Mycena chlorophos]
MARDGKSAKQLAMEQKLKGDLKMGKSEMKRVRKTAKAARADFTTDGKEEVPKGQSGRSSGGYQLQTRLGLAGEDAFYHKLKNATLYIAGQHLPLSRSYSKLDPNVLATTCKLIRNLIPFFQDLKGIWAIQDFIKQRCQNNRSGLNKTLRSLGVEPKGAQKAKETGNASGDGDDSGSDNSDDDEELTEEEDSELEEAPPPPSKKQKTGKENRPIEKPKKSAAKTASGKKKESTSKKSTKEKSTKRKRDAPEDEDDTPLPSKAKSGKKPSRPAVVEPNAADDAATATERERGRAAGWQLLGQHNMSDLEDRVAKFDKSCMRMITDPNSLKTLPMWLNFVAVVGAQNIFKFGRNYDGEERNEPPELTKLAQCGYYGRVGGDIIQLELMERYGYNVDDRRISDTILALKEESWGNGPKTFTFPTAAFMRYILTPMVAVLLIRQDLKVSKFTDAYDILGDSNEFGRLFNSKQSRKIEKEIESPPPKRKSGSSKKKPATDLGVTELTAADFAEAPRKSKREVRVYCCTDVSLA